MLAKKPRTAIISVEASGAAETARESCTRSSSSWWIEVLADATEEAEATARQPQMPSTNAATLIVNAVNRFMGSFPLRISNLAHSKGFTLSKPEKAARRPQKKPPQGTAFKCIWQQKLRSSSAKRCSRHRLRARKRHSNAPCACKFRSSAAHPPDRRSRR